MNLLDQLDPLPDMRPPLGMQQRCYRQNGSWVDLPASERQKKEEADICAKESGEDWRPHTPGFAINGKGQIRTVAYVYYEPPKPPETDVVLMVNPDCYEVFWPNGISQEDWLPKFTHDLDTWVSREAQGCAVPFEHKWKIADLRAIYAPEPQTQPAEQRYNFNSKTGEVALIDRDGWIPHTPGDPMPCDGSIKVFRRWRNGKETQSADYARDRDWGENNSEYAITAWKPA